jgi:hypothetical protein
LRAGDEVYALDGTAFVITGSWLEVFDEPVVVYNLEVSDFHSYFVGEFGGLVHNNCGSGSSDENRNSGNGDKNNGDRISGASNHNRAKGDFINYKNPNQIEKKFGLERGSYHPSGANGIKSDILSDASKYFADDFKKMGSNPDISIANDGQIMIQSTLYKGKSFITDLNIFNY